MVANLIELINKAWHYASTESQPFWEDNYVGMAMAENPTKPVLIKTDNDTLVEQ